MSLPVKYTRKIYRLPLTAQRDIIFQRVDSVRLLPDPLQLLLAGDLIRRLLRPFSRRLCLCLRVERYRRDHSGYDRCSQKICQHSFPCPTLHNPLIPPFSQQYLFVADIIASIPYANFIFFNFFPAQQKQGTETAAAVSIPCSSKFYLYLSITRASSG